MTGIRTYGYFVSRQRRVEAAPSGAGLKLRLGTKQLISARGAEVDSLCVIVPILILVWRLCSPFAQNMKLHRCQNFPPFVRCEVHLAFIGSDSICRRIRMASESSATQKRTDKVHGKDKTRKRSILYQLSAIDEQPSDLRFLQAKFFELRQYYLPHVRSFRHRLM
jgi:hypothetical protein